jgi:phage gp29-like protein
MGNWANFTQLFGMPFREARYSGYNEATRLQIEQGLQSMGSAGYGIFPDDAKIDFHEANNVQANGLLYDTLRKACNEELSMLILGQTGTTIQTPGKLGGENTNAQTEDDINADDRKFELAVMNEKVLPILSNLGYKVDAGLFAYEEVREDVKPTEWQLLNTLKNQIKLPLDDDFIYEIFGIPKPDNYDELKAEAGRN